MKSQSRFAALAVAALLGAVLAMPDTASAVPGDNPRLPQAEPAPAPAAKSDAATKKIKKKVKASKKKKKPEKKTENEFLARYRLAYDLIYKKRDYAAGIAALRALGHDDHADVANLVGFASRKLSRYDDAKYWYEKALAADPKHTRTWQYYGLWHLEQGNRLKAEEHLDKIAAICGTSCEDYKSLKLALVSGKTVY